MTERLGALAGWTWTETPGGVTLKLQMAGSVEDFRERRFQHVILSLNDRQLRSIIRDLSRAAAVRGLPLFAKRSWWQRVRRIVAIRSGPRQPKTGALRLD